jgi:flagellar motor component MotA
MSVYGVVLLLVTLLVSPLYPGVTFKNFFSYALLVIMIGVLFGLFKLGIAIHKVKERRNQANLIENEKQFELV